MKINRFVNYLLLNKYGNVFQYEVKCFEVLSFKDKLKVNIWNRFENRILIDFLEMWIHHEICKGKGKLF